MYTIEEQIDEKRVEILGEPIRDLMVAKVVASRRARLTHRPTVVRDEQTGREISRYPLDASKTGS
jgi:hypothetical protein